MWSPVQEYTLLITRTHVCLSSKTEAVVTATTCVITKVFIAYKYLYHPKLKLVSAQTV